MTLGDGDKIIDLYNQGVGTNNLAKQFNCHRTTIQRLLKNNNIKLRKKSPILSYNTSFFSKYNEKSCYWAGFILADGCIRSDRNSLDIHLNINDYEHLVKFAKEINYKGKVLKYHNSCRITINGEWFVNDLKNNFGIIPQKSLVSILHSKIPVHYINHYLRGLFDGDGSISKKNNYMAITFSSGSMKLLEQLSIIFNVILGVNIRENCKNQTNKPKICGIQITYHCANANRIMDYLYFNSTNKIRLDRKYNKYLEFKDKKRKEK